MENEVGTTPLGFKDDSISSSTPLSASNSQAGAKPDVSKLFEQMGSKLGWFQFSDLDEALKSLSKSTKKKSSKARRPRADQNSVAEQHDKTSKSEKKGHRKAKSERSKHSKTKDGSSVKSTEKENLDGNLKQIKKHSDHDLPFKELDFHENNGQDIDIASETGCVPVHSSKAQTDLTVSPQQISHRKKKDRQNALSLKKNRMKETLVSNSKPSDTSSSDLQRIDDNKNEERTENVSCRSSSESPEDLSFGNPIQESTRIMSESCIAGVLDPTNMSKLSFNQSDSSSWLDKSNDDSYKQLNIHCKKEEKTGDICLNLKSMQLADEDVTETNKTKHSIEPELFITAVNSLSHNSSESSRKSSSSSLSYLCEVQDAATQVDSDFENFCARNSNEDKPCHMFVKGDNHSSPNNSSKSATCSDIVESVNNLSVRKSSDSSGSFIEVADASIQTSEHGVQNTPSDKLPIPSEGEGSFTEVKDTSSLQLKCGEADDTSYTDNRDIQIDHSGGILVDDDIIVLENDNVVKKFNKREPSIYFDAKDLSTERNKFQYKKRDPSLYFDAKQTLSDSSVSSESVGHRSLSPIKDDDDEDESLSTNQNDSEESIEVIDDNVDDNFYCENQEVLADSETDSFCKADSPDGRNPLSSSDDNNIVDTGSKPEVIISDSSDDSLSSPVNLRARLLNKKRDDERKNGTGQSVKQDSGVQQETSHWRTKKQVDLDSSSDDDLENFFQKMKKTTEKSSEEETEELPSLEEFIVADCNVSSGSDDEGFYLSTNSSLHTKDSKRTKTPVIYLDSDDDDDVFKTPASTRKISRKPKLQKSDSFGRMFKDSTPEYTYSFLKSLTENLPHHNCDPDALKYVKNFKKYKEELTKRLFKLYNETIFENQLPDDLEILWNNRLLRTAGYCAYKRKKDDRTVRVELSIKVCDSAERTRDTLIHELCHAAVWLLNGKTDGHGPYWKYWARKSNKIHPEIPVIGRCHSYSIATKYTYMCSKCGYRIGRHSKSLNTERQFCGYCHGAFVLLSNNGKKSGNSTSATPKTPRTPNKFALFVKENYGEIKRRENVPHKDVMRILSQEFAKSKIS